MLIFYNHTDCYAHLLAEKRVKWISLLPHRMSPSEKLTESIDSQNGVTSFPSAGDHDHNYAKQNTFSRNFNDGDITSQYLNRSHSRTHSQAEIFASLSRQDENEMEKAMESTDGGAIQVGKDPAASIYQKQHDFEIPDGGYGWVNVGVMFFTSFCCWGGNAGFSIYLANYIKNHEFGGSGEDFAAVGGLAFGSGFFFAPLITYFVGLTSANASLFLGAACQLAAMLLASFATKMWHLYLTQGMLMGFGLALVAAPVPSILPQWFSKKRSLAMGIGAAGSGAGGILFNLAMQKLVEVKSVRWALRAQTIICVVIIVICAFLLKTRGDKIKPEFKPWDFQVSKLFAFWLIVAWVVFTIFGYVVVQYCLSDATIALGYSAYSGSIASALLNVGVLFGRPLVGLLADRLGAITVATLVYLLCGIFCLAMWIPARNLGTIMSFGILMGALMGCIWGAMGAIIPRIVGLRKVGVTFGMTWVCIGIGGIVSPIIGLALKKDLPEGVTMDKSQYTWAALFSGLSFVLASLSLAILRGYVIARDTLAGEEADSDHGDALTLKVPPSLVLKHFWTIKTEKKV